MKKILLWCLLGLLLCSCNLQGTSFETNDLSGFLDALKQNNYTVSYAYEIYNSGESLYDVTCDFKVDEDRILIDSYYYNSGEKHYVVHTEKYVYYDSKKDTYINYTRQVDKSSGEEILSFTKTEDTINDFNTVLREGVDIIFNIYDQFQYDEVNKQFKSKTTTIKIDQSVITVINSNKGNNSSRLNISATYELIGKTKISEPSFIRKYKEDIIPGY